MKYKALIFDTDGVVVRDCEMFSERFVRDYHAPKEEVVSFFKQIFSPRIVSGALDLKEALSPLLERWGWDGSVEDLLTYWFEGEKNLDTAVIEFIEAQKKNGVHCFLATNNEKYRTAYLRDIVGFGELFDMIYASGEIGYKKPDVHFYQYIFDDLSERLVCKKDEILFIDDDMENIVAAKDFGFDVVHYTTFLDIEDIGL